MSLSSISTPGTVDSSDFSATSSYVYPQVIGGNTASHQISCQQRPLRTLEQGSPAVPTFNDRVDDTICAKRDLKTTKTTSVLTCGTCRRKTFSRPCDLKRHTTLHSRPHECSHPTCTYAFSTSKDLRRHEKVHSRVRPYLCPYAACKFARKGFPRKDARTRHVRGVHGGMDKLDGMERMSCNG